MNSLYLVVLVEYGSNNTTVPSPLNVAINWPSTIRNAHSLLVFVVIVRSCWLCTWSKDVGVYELYMDWCAANPFPVALDPLLISSAWTWPELLVTQRRSLSAVIDVNSDPVIALSIVG